MENIPLGEIIAERYLEVKDETGEEHEIIVRIGKPIPDPNPGGDWCCPYEIVGFANNYTSAAFGIDSVQALMLVLQKIAAELSYKQRAERMQLTWLEQEDLGFS